MTKTGKLYGDSLYELAVQTQRDGRSGYVKSLQEQLAAVQKLFRENPDYVRLLSEPSIPRKERLELIDKAFGTQAEEYLVNFLKLLCEGELLSEFAGCCEEFKLRYQKDNNIAEAYVTSAVALNETQKAALKEKLEQLYQKEILLVTGTDPSVMGGMKVEIEGKQLDGTIRSRLERLHKRIRMDD